MSEEEIRSFMDDLRKDKGLRGQFDLHQLIDHTLSQPNEMRFRRKIREIIFRESEMDTSGSNGWSRGLHTPGKRIIIYLGTAIAVIILLFMYLYNDHHITPDKLYSTYFTRYTQDVMIRSSHTSERNPLSVAVFYYLEEDYNKSEALFTELLDADSTNVSARFYKGLSEIALGNFSTASEDFSSLLNLDFSFYQEHARWYLALCYLKMNQTNEAEGCFTELKNQNSVYAERSEKILQILSDCK